MDGDDPMAERKGCGRILALAAGAVCLATSDAPAQAADYGGHLWKTFGNSRYGYSVCYPADLFRPQAEPDAHDGVVFDGPTPQEVLSVSGETAAPSKMAEVLGLVVKTMHGRSTYAAKGPDWQVASGLAEGKIFYSRVVAGENVVAQLILSYPATDKTKYAPVIRRMNACLKIG